MSRQDSSKAGKSGASQKGSKGNTAASEAGIQGQDRQPVKGHAKSTLRNPEPGEAASPAEVAGRSKEAGALQKKGERQADFNHPGPDRLEAEKSKGNVHHDQHEGEPDMQEKVKEL